MSAVFSLFAPVQSPWQQYFQDAELKKQIVLDIRRVYPENGFFKDKDLQEMMLRILFIYAREHEHILYKQVQVFPTLTSLGVGG
jgi:hypothetical protein